MPSCRDLRARGAGLVAATAVLALLAGCSGGDAGGSGGDAGGSRGSGGSGGSGSSTGSSGPAPTDEASAAPAEGTARVVETVARGLRAPWGLVQLPDGDLLAGLRDEGTVQLVPADGGETVEAGRVPGVSFGGEGGLLGLALSPGFADDGTLYAYYTTESDNRISRFTYAPEAPPGERLRGGETVLAGIPRGEFIHHGGGLAVGPDGMLYAATGDTGDGALAQDGESLAGKILRIDPGSGRPAAGNPDPGSYVYSMGHRNVQGLAWDATGQLWATEFGESTWDELNRIEAGGNYGWPAHEGRGGADEGFTDPVAQWPPAEASPSGLAFSQGSLWAAGLRGERLWRLPLDGREPAGEPEAFLTGEHGRLRGVLATGGNDLLVLTNETDTRGSPQGGDDRVLRVRVS